jgi:hypothetical protein
VVATHPLVLTIRVVPADRVVPVDRADPAITQVARADRVVPVDRAIIPAARADPAAIPVARADRVAQVARVARVARVIIPADPADPAITPVPPTDSVDRILTLVARGTATPSAVTSAGHRGAMGLAPGGRVPRRGRHGIDRSLRPVGAGTTARSITGATRKRPSGIPVSTSGVSGSSECGSRCDR